MHELVDIIENVKSPKEKVFIWSCVCGKTGDETKTRTGARGEFEKHRKGLVVGSRFVEPSVNQGRRPVKTKSLLGY